MIDAELIAKVLDGRATAEERARVLAEADKSPELLALLSDSAAAMPQEEAKVIPIHRRPVSLRFIAAGIAAVLVAGVVLPRFIDHPNEGPVVVLFDVPATPSAIAAASVSSAAAVRGGADDDRARLSATIGARLTDYITLGTDSARVRAAAEIAAALRTIPGASIAATRFDDAPPASREMIDAVEQVVDVHAFRTASAAELIRLAAQGGDSAVLRGDNVRTAAEYLAADPRIPIEARTLAQGIKADLERRATGDLAGRANQLVQMLVRR